MKRRTMRIVGVTILSAIVFFIGLFGDYKAVSLVRESFVSFSIPPEQQQSSSSSSFSIAHHSKLNDDDENDFIKMQKWREERNTGKYLKDWFYTKSNNDDDAAYIVNTIFKNSTSEKKSSPLLLHRNADSRVQNGGPILDFVVGGFPKCGTTGMMKQLMGITPYPGGDQCGKATRMIKMSFGKWPKSQKANQNNNNINNNSTTVTTTDKFLRGYKCPRALDTDAQRLGLGGYLPKTKLIVGIRHPVLWFQSFYNMQMENSPRVFKNIGKYDKLITQKDSKKRMNYRGCPGTHLFCVARAEFHITLSKLGKTPLRSNEELKLLRSVESIKNRETNTIFAKNNNNNNNNNGTATKNNNTATTQFSLFFGLPNPIMVYEFSQPTKEYFYDELGRYLQIQNKSHILLPNGTDSIGFVTESNRAKRFRGFDICDPARDPLRQQLLPVSYNLHEWLVRYFVPASQTRKDVTIPNVTEFVDLIQSYKEDPCKRLIRNSTDGSYYLDPSIVSSYLQDQVTKAVTNNYDNNLRYTSIGTNNLTIITEDNNGGRPSSLHAL